MAALPPSPTMTRLHRESKEVFSQLFREKVPDASLEKARRRVAEKYGCSRWPELRGAATEHQNGVPGEPDPAHLQLLVDAGAKEHPHSGSWLYDHLVGTRDLLAEWGNPHHLAVAGPLPQHLRHRELQDHLGAPRARREVAQCIGVKAEALSFVFCVSHRVDFVTQLGRHTPMLKDVVHATEIAPTPDDLQQLIELEVTNCVEQIYPERVKPSRVPLLKRMLLAPISEGARVSLEDLISKCETTRATARTP